MDKEIDEVIRLVQAENNQSYLCGTLELLKNRETTKHERAGYIEEIDQIIRDFFSDERNPSHEIYLAWIATLYNTIQHYVNEFQTIILEGDKEYPDAMLQSLLRAKKNGDPTYFYRKRGIPDFSENVNLLWDKFHVELRQVEDLAIIDHCQRLQSSLMFVDCAGKPAILSELFQNKALNPVNLCFNALILIQLVGNHGEEMINLGDHERWMKDVKKVCKDSDKELYDQIIRKASNEEEKFWFQKDYSRPVNSSLSTQQKNIHSLVEGLKAYCNCLSEDTKKYLNTRLYNLEKWLNYDKLHAKDFVTEEAYDDESMDTYSRRILAILSAEPGCGKTIALKQYCLRKAELTERYLIDLREILEQRLRGEAGNSWALESYYLRDHDEDQNTLIPIFVSAKNLANQIQVQKAHSPHGELIGGRFSAEALVLLAQEHTLPEMGKSNLWRFSTSISDMCLFVDAFDECSGDEKQAIIEFIKTTDSCSFIFTIRTQEIDSLAKPLMGIGGSEIMHARFDYTKQELNESMPTKLALAWGQNEDIMQLTFNHYLGEYEPVLTHPVFVGLFCRLMSEGELGGNKYSSHPLKDESLGNYSVKHVQFYQHVINIGLGMLIKNRHEVTEQELLDYKRAFGLVAWYFTYEGLDNFDEIYAHLQIYHGVDFTPHQREILKHDMTLLYAAGERVKEIHLQVFETGVGQILASEPELRQRMNSKYFDHEVDGTVFLSYMLESNPESKEHLEELKVQTMVDLGTPAAKVMLREQLSIPLFVDLTPRLAYRLEGSDLFHQKIIQRFFAFYEDKGRIPFDLPMHSFSILPGKSLAFVHRNLQELKPIEVGMSFWNFPDIHPSEWGSDEAIHAVEAYTRYILSEGEGSRSEKDTQRFLEYRKLGVKILRYGDLPHQEVMVHLIGNTTENELNLDKEFLNLFSQTTEIDLTDIGALEKIISVRKSVDLAVIQEQHIVHKILQNSMQRVQGILLDLMRDPAKVRLLGKKEIQDFLRVIKNRDALIKFIIHRTPAKDQLLTKTISVIEKMYSNGLIPARCSQCDLSDVRLDLDHIIPIKYGGRTELSNLTFSCQYCNAKGAYSKFNQRINTGRSSIQGFKSENKISNELDIGSLGEDD